MSMIKKTTINGVLDILSALFTIVSIAMYAVYCRTGTNNPLVYTVLAGAVVLAAVTFLIQKEWTIWVRILRVICLSLSIGLFIASAESVLSFTDYIFKIDYWGNAELVPEIIRTAVSMILALICTMITCYKKPAMSDKATD